MMAQKVDLNTLVKPVSKTYLKRTFKEKF
jgi:hypothetical protein